MTSTSRSKVPARAAPPSAPAPRGKLAPLPLLALGLGYFLVMFDVTSVNVAIPHIESALRSGAVGGQWVVDGYSMVFAALLLLGGGLGDRFGSRRVYLAGLAAFAATSLVCALAPGIGVLVAGRLLQGAAGALLVPSSLSLLAASYPQRGLRARAVGIWAGISGIAFAAGPVLGGFLVAGLSWRTVFWLNMPFAAVAAALTLRFLPSTRHRTTTRMDVFGQLLALAGLAGIAGALNEAGTAGWGSFRVMAPVVTGVVALVAFVRRERRLEHRRSADRDGVIPLLPPSLLRNTGLAAATVIGALLNFGFYGLLFLIPAYFQRQLHYSPLTTGLAMLPAVGMALFASPLSGRITARHGSFRPMTIFMLMGTFGSLGWLLATPTSPYTTAFLPLAATGLAAPLTVTAVTTAALESVPAEKAGVASAMLTTSRQMGSALGVALFGTLAATSPTLLSGLHLSAVLASLAFLTGSLLAFAAARGK